MEQDNATMNKVLQRVKKMMALAHEDSGASEGERDNALRMAHATLAKHNLSMGDVDAATAERDDPRGLDGVETKNLAWARRVGNSIATLFFCKYFFMRSRTSRSKVRHCFVGRASNVETAKYITEFVIKSIMKEAYANWQQHAEPSVWWTSFCKGAASMVRERCDELRAAAEAASEKAKTPGTALVLASVYRTELALNDTFLAEQLKVKLTTGVNRERRTSAVGYDDGRQFGARVSLTRQVTGGSSAKRLHEK